ncbi:MAG: GspE/PulE family protein [Puniceicoccaceae bacterium]
MPVYEPFLIPYVELERKSGKPFSAQSPIEEEQALQGIPRLWEQLGEKLQRTIGIPLLTELPEGSHPTIPDDIGNQPSPGRILLLQGPQESWFVLEHPSALPHFDRLRQGQQRPALARPSLFLEWYSQALSALEVTSGSVKPDAVREKSVIALHAFLSQLNAERLVSDWHLEPAREGYVSRLRVDGRLEKHTNLTTKKGNWLLNSVVRASGLGNLPADSPADGSFRLRKGTMMEIHARVSLVPTCHGRSMVVRFLHPPAKDALKLEHLGFGPRQVRQVHDEFHHPDGLWLVAGPTGCGKSTTLYSLLQIAVHMDEKILTAEDPVEVFLPGIQQVEVDEQSGETFAILLKAFMRQAPDTILIGEVRDEETAAIAIQAANSGHRILASVHASSNNGILRRFQDLGQSPGIVRATCAAVIHQRLIRLVCRICSSFLEISPSVRELLDWVPGGLPDSVVAAEGCQECRRGYAGRIGIFDVSTSLSGGDTRLNLFQAAWPLLVRQRITLECLLPYFPRPVRRKFTLCHV